MEWKVPRRQGLDLGLEGLVGGRAGIKTQVSRQGQFPGGSLEPDCGEGRSEGGGEKGGGRQKGSTCGRKSLDPRIRTPGFRSQLCH